MRMSLARKIVLYVLLCLLGLMTAFPFVWMVSTSFKTSNEVFSLRPNLIPRNLFTDKMWDNYRTILVKHKFLRYVQNSLFVATTAAFGQLVACSLAGFAFARMNFMGKEVLFGMLLATLMIPVEVTIIPEYLIMLKLGWYNTYLPLIVPSMMIGSFGTFLFRGFFENIPTALEDAAFIDGVNSWQMFYKVFLPNAKPAIASLFIIAFMNNWNDLLRPVIYLDSDHLWTATMGLMQFKGNYGTQWHLLLTGSLISVLPLITVYVLMQRYFVEGMLSSGMKG